MIASPQTNSGCHRKFVLAAAIQIAVKAELQTSPIGLIRCYFSGCSLVVAAIALELWIRVVTNWGISPRVDPLLGISNRLTAALTAGFSFFVFLFLVTLKDGRTKGILMLWFLVLSGTYRLLRWGLGSGDHVLTGELFGFLPLSARGHHIMILAVTAYLWGGSVGILTFEIFERYWQRLSPGYRKAVIIWSWVTALTLAVPPVQVAYVGVKNPTTTMPMVLQQLRHSNVGSNPLLYQWMPLDPAWGDLIQVLVTAEDRRFFQHRGYDWQQIRSAISRSYQTGQRIVATSSITQQCARSLFLWQGRSWIRKALEAYYTFWMELLLSKRRILELYANVIEFGDGVYGIEAAAQHYYGVPASRLTREQVTSLVVVMPNPKQRDPLNPNEAMRKHQRQLSEQSERFSLPQALLK